MVEQVISPPPSGSKQFLPKALISTSSICGLKEKSSKKGFRCSSSDRLPLLLIFIYGIPPSHIFIFSFHFSLFMLLVIFSREMCDQLRGIGSYFSLNDPLESYPSLAEFHRLFAALPNNTRYFASRLATLPTNNLNAVTYGSTPNGSPWQLNPDQPLSWHGSSGAY